MKHPLVAQMDRALVYETKGQEFESLLAGQFLGMSLSKDGDSTGSSGQANPVALPFFLFAKCCIMVYNTCIDYERGIL